MQTTVSPLKELGDDDLTSDSDDDPTYRGMLTNITKAVGADMLPQAAHEEKPSNHSDAIVNATLGGLTRRLVESGDAQGARDSCAEWMGVASPLFTDNRIVRSCFF